MQDWIKDKSNSVQAFDKIKDTILPKLITGKLVSIEMTESEVLAWMDIYSGIDLIRKDETGLQGVAWRAQWCKAWDSFTIRMTRQTGTKTELEKRLWAIQNGYFYPAFTIQAYFDNTVDMNCLSVGIIRTKDLFQAYQNTPDIFQVRRSDNEFIYVNWSDLKGKVKVWRSNFL